MEEKLKALKTECLNSIKTADNLHSLQEIEVKYLGRKGELTNILRGLKDLSDSEKPLVGKLGNKIKVELETKIERNTKRKIIFSDVAFITSLKFNVNSFYR